MSQQASTTQGAITPSQMQRYATSFVAFAADLHVPLGGGSGRLGDVWADFQERDFRAIASSLVAVAAGEVPTIKRAWFERTKGASKDSDCCIAILWLLAFARRPMRIQVGAFDQQQASEIRFIIKAILAIDAPLNRLLASVIDVQKDRVIGHAKAAGRVESMCEVLTTDAYGSHGARPDVVIANELSHVGSQAFMETLFDNADKVPHSLVIVATNAGEVSTWQEKWRGIARDSDRWHFSVIDYPAPWISEADLAESRLRNSPSRFARLWRGVWSSGEGDGIPLSDIQACTVLRGPHGRRDGMFFVGGIDLSIRGDRTAVAILGVDVVQSHVELMALKTWRPADCVGREVDLTEVQSFIIECSQHYGAHTAFCFDPWQAHHMSQSLRQQGITMIEWPFTPANLSLMATSAIEAFREREIKLYPDDEIERDLLSIRFKETTTGGYKMSAVRSSLGHADSAYAILIALPMALAIARNGAEILTALPSPGGDEAGVLVPH